MGARVEAVDGEVDAGGTGVSQVLDAGPHYRGAKALSPVVGVGAHHAYPTLGALFATLKPGPVKADGGVAVEDEKDVIEGEEAHSDLVVDVFGAVGAVAPVFGEGEVLDEAEAVFVACAEVAEPEAFVEVGGGDGAGVVELHFPEFADESEAATPGEPPGVESGVGDGHLDNLVAEVFCSVDRGLDESGADALAQVIGVDGAFEDDALQGGFEVGNEVADGGVAVQGEEDVTFGVDGGLAEPDGEVVGGAGGPPAVVAVDGVCEGPEPVQV